MTADITSREGNPKGDKHRRIIDAAARVFAARGFFNAKVADIAREAQVADGTIYLYFKNKDDLLISLFEETMTAIIGRLRLAVEEVDDPLEQLRRFIAAHAEMALENRDLLEVITVELRQSAKFMKDYKNEKFSEYLEILAGMLRRGVASGVLRQDLDVDLTKRAVFGMIDELNLYVVLSKRPAGEVVARASASVARILLDGLVAR